MDIAITGSTGLIGHALAAALTADGHQVHPVVRSASNDPAAIAWDPAAGTIDVGALEGLDAVVHLAGEGIASHRWTRAQKDRIRASRQEGTRVLADAIAGLDRKPEVLVSGSAIGIYGGGNGATVLTETSPPGDDFLAQVCVGWEAATAPAREAGVRVALARTGVVLSTRGGALAKQLRPFRLGLGAKSGKGRQYLSWISLDDEVTALRFLIDHPVEGPVNLTAPEPVTNLAFTHALGAALHRSAILTIPTLVAQLPGGVGELADSLLFASQRVQPEVLLAAGFTFADTDLAATLERILAA